ncbi:MAG TPA: SDR family NAD(P)-dependent oxidoreductase, partial [Kofleriaceae bacterium]
AGVCALVAACLADVLALDDALALVVQRAGAPAATSRPRIPLLSSATGRWIEPDEAADPRTWHAWSDRAAQAVPERWRSALADAGLVALEVAASPGVGSRPARMALLNTLGRLHLANAAIDWAAVHAGRGRGRVSLPAYPFERQRYWVAAPRSAAARPARIGKRANLETWTYVPSWRRAPSARPAECAGPLRWLIFCDRSGVGRRLAQDLAGSGHPVVTVDAGDRYVRTAPQAYAIDPCERSDYARLLASIGAERPEPIVQIVHLWSVDAAERASVAEVMSRGSRSLVYLAQALAQGSWTHPITMTVVGSEAQDVLGDEPIVPAKATVLAPVIGIPQELPGITCRYLDIELPSSPATSSAPLSERILAEALGASPQSVIAYRGRHRWIHGHEPLAVPASAASASGLRRGGVYLITGGLGSLGLVFAEHLARRYQARLVLTSRGGRAEEPRLRAFEQLGAEVMAVAADVADADQMRALVQQIAGRFGQLHGVIHAAGRVQGDAFPAIARCTPEQWEAQLRPKVAGTLVLADVLPEGLDFCVVFSSLASALGGQGLCAYAAANQFMDGFVQEHNRVRRPGSTPWLSVNWDYWQTAAPRRPEALGSMLFRATDAGRAELGITAEEGTEMFERLVSPRRSAVAQVLVATGDLEARVARWVHRGSPAGPSELPEEPAPAPHARPRPGVPHTAPRDPTEAVTEATIARIWQDVLGIPELGVDDDIFALGGDSLHALQFGARVQAELGIELSVHELLEAPTVARLADRVRRRQGERSGTAKPGTDTPRVAASSAIQAHPFAVPATASSDERKHHLRRFYDAITEQLDASDVGRLSWFLNLGYVADDSPRHSAIEVPDHLLNASSIRLVLEVIGDGSLTADSEILDVGCGRGGTISQIHEHFAVKHATGLDLSPAAIAFCRDRHRRPDTRFACGDAEAMPFPDAAFDAVINVESSHSYPDLRAFYREVHRVLRPGGQFLYTDLFPAAAVSACVADLRQCGFEVVRDRDISRNVLLSCDRAGRARMQVFAAGNDATVMADFLAAPGSKTYDDLAGGRSTYRIFKLQKPPRGR